MSPFYSVLSVVYIFLIKYKDCDLFHYYTLYIDPDERMQNLEGKVLELEDKVIDLESDNKGLKDDKDKLVVEKEGLLEQISVSA